jgi:hypothetical protein
MILADQIVLARSFECGAVIGRRAEMQSRDDVRQDVQHRFNRNLKRVNAGVKLDSHW